MIDFSSWLIYKGFSEGSGRSKKIWLENEKNKEIGLFKYRKSKETTEHFSEKLASEIAKIIGLSSAEIKIGKYKNEIGSMSYQILRNESINKIKSNQSLIEGVRLINRFYPEYDKDSLYDVESGEFYSLKMIRKSLSYYEENDFFKDILKMMIFDFFIGNSDRHHSNWAIIQNSSTYVFCPLYDNGSSLCCYIKEDNIDKFLGNDRQKFMSLVDSKSRSRIRIDETKKKEPTHKEVLKYIYKNYRSDVKAFIDNFLNKLTEDKIDSLVNSLGNNVITDKRKRLIFKFLLEKRNIIITIFRED